MPRLTEQEQQEILRFLEADKPLPDKFRFLLFEDKREVELVWNGKTSEVCNIVLPFQVIEQVDEPRAEKPEDASPQGLLFDERGRQLKGWTNKLIWGDNKLILSSLKNGPLREEIEKQGGLKLIYIDPPFDVGADFSMDIEIGDETFTKKPNILEEVAYRDTWGKGADSFISMLYERLILMRDLMQPEGSIYIHIGSKVSHLIRAIAEEVFGRDKSRAELIWKRTSAHANVTNNYGAIHDAVLFLTKSERWIWNQQYAGYDKAYVELFFDQVDNGRRYARRDLTASMTRASSGQIYTWKGITPTGSRCWAMTKEKMDELAAQGRIHWPKEKGGMPRLKFYEDEAVGVPLQDIWDDVGAMHNLST
jgi:adenine-specific DNA-methyltransferase